MKRLQAWLNRAAEWAADALEGSYHGQRDHFGADPGMLDTYEPLDHPHHRKDTPR